MCMGSLIVHLRQLGWCTWSSNQAMGWTVQGSVIDRCKTFFFIKFRPGLVSAQPPV
jgi:hypothetical protein